MNLPQLPKRTSAPTPSVPRPEVSAPRGLLRYTDQRKLSWSSFTLTDSRPTLKGIQRDALVSMSFEFLFAEPDPNNSNNRSVFIQRVNSGYQLRKPDLSCLLVKERSLAHEQKIRRNSLQENIELLKHERVHVAIHVKWARVLLKQIKQLTVPVGDPGKATQDLINKSAELRKQISEQCALENDEYDVATGYGLQRSDAEIKQQQVYNAKFLSEPSSEEKQSEENKKSK